MADFTLELRSLVEMVGADHIGLSDYPIFDEQYREFLNAKIIDHFWYNEIAHETPDMFIRQMQTKMNEIMPYYNRWYESELVKIDPLSTQDMHGESSGESSSDSSFEHSGRTGSKNLTKSGSASKTRTVQSETPQVMLSGDQDYATSAQDVHSDIKGNNDVVSSGDSSQKGSDKAGATSKSGSHTYGYTGHAPQLIMQWRESFVNVDMMVISELEVLFMGLHTSNDTFTEGGVLGGLWY